MKNSLELDLISGWLTSRARFQVDEFVKRLFVDKVEHLPREKEKVQW
jgi:hypothetical protein